MWFDYFKRVYPNQVIAEFELKRVHFIILFLTGMAGFQNLMAGHLIMRARKDTFVKNKALVEQQFGEIHRKTFNSSLSELG